MIRIKRTLFTVGTLALFFILAGYSSGVANFSNLGQTGAPNGDGDLEGTCGVCHNTGNFGEPEIKVLFDDEMLTQYTPGKTYEVSVFVTAERNTPAAYGFQAQFLSGVGTSPQRAGMLQNPASNVQVSDGQFSRRYAEHSLASPDSTFRFEWVAPEVGTGPVEMFVVANTVNLSGNVNGDNGSVNPAVVTLGEGAPTGIRSLPSIPLAIQPNPTTNNWSVSLEVPVGGDYQMTLFDARGRVWQRDVVNLRAAANLFSVSGVDLPAGVYLLRLHNGASAALTRLVKQ